LAHHPSDFDLRTFLACRSSRDPLLDQRVVGHLLRGCSFCRERLNTLDPSGGWRPAPRPAAAIDYDDVLARAEQTFSLFFVDGRPVTEPPGVLLAELAPGMGLEEPALVPGRDPRRSIPVLVRWLIAKSHAARYEEPKAMLHWGLMAHLAAGSCSAQAVGSRPRLADLRARAWGQFGNALRVCGRFREAGEVLATAHDYLDAGTGDPALRARFYEQMASLRINQRAFSSATDLLEEAKVIHEEIGETCDLASVLLQQAVVHQYSGEPERCLPLIERALSLLTPAEDTDLLLVARLNRVHAYASTGQAERALAAFHAARDDDWYGRPALMLRAYWLEGQILAEVGHLEAAVAKLRCARHGFVERNLAPEVVLTSHHLAGVYRAMGKRRDLEQTVLDTQALFFGIPAEAEVLASLQELERMLAA
jgi:tetratricopeptide (TPR) repeat protein